MESEPWDILQFMRRPHVRRIPKTNADYYGGERLFIAIDPNWTHGQFENEEPLNMPIKIETDVPIPKGWLKPRTSEKLEVVEAMKSIAPGQSLEVGEHLSAFVRQMAVKSPGKFVTRRDKEKKTIRVWKLNNQETGQIIGQPKAHEINAKIS